MRRFVLLPASGAAVLRLLWERYRAEAVAAIIALTAVPLLFGWVPPNPYYGFRTPRSMSSPEAWYRANEIMACYLLASQALALRAKRYLTEALIARWGRDEATWATPWVCAAALLGVLGSVAHYYLLG
ncbi:MAG: SdpI family protein [Bryobacterales bacterium]|nr:SdpI family protein [Bryobacterales bacterium]